MQSGLTVPYLLVHGDWAVMQLGVLDAWPSSLPLNAVSSIRDLKKPGENHQTDKLLPDLISRNSPVEAGTKLQHPLAVVLKLSRGYWCCWHAAYAQQTQYKSAYLLPTTK